MIRNPFFFVSQFFQLNFNPLYQVLSHFEISFIKKHLQHATYNSNVVSPFFSETYHEILLKINFRFEFYFLFVVFNKLSEIITKL